MEIRKAITLAGLVLAVAAPIPEAALANAGGTDRPLSGSGAGTSAASAPTMAGSPRDAEGEGRFPIDQLAPEQFGEDFTRSGRDRSIVMSSERRSHDR